LNVLGGFNLPLPIRKSLISFQELFMSTGTVQSRTTPGSFSTSGPQQHGSNRTLVLLSFVAVYFIWGSTFFAIRIGIESFPPLLVPAMRHLSVGLIFYPVFRFVSREKPTAVQWRTAIVTGFLLLTVGNGIVSWAEQFVPSGITALLVATVCLWMVLIDWLRPGGSRPAPRVFAGVLLGFAGMALLVGPKNLGGSDRVSPFGTLILVLASLAWAYGSIYSKHNPLPHSAMLGVAMQCLAGGIALLVAATISGELHSFHWANVTTRSWLAVIYLGVFGSGVGFSAYVYLIKHSSSTHLSTYAFVNPVVALLLGWSLGGEPLTSRTIIASSVILGAVILVITAPHKTSGAADESLPAAGEA
jgi:drug/metabolite transporter (DMT)-like permease